MRALAAIGYLVVGLINLAPIVGVMGISHLERLYAVDIASQDLSVLLMHRAVLLGLVGALLVAAAFSHSLRVAAAIAGTVSMGSYALLILANEVSNPALVKIAWIDVGAMVILAIAWLAHRKRP